MNIALMRDVGAHLITLNCFNPVILNANSTAENNVEQNGIVIDRELVSPSKAVQLSMQAAVLASWSQIAAANLTVKFNIQDALSSTGPWTDYDDIKGTTVQSVTVGTTGSTAAQTGNLSQRANFDLSGAKRYLRMQLTADFLGTTTTDDADVAAVMVLGGYDTVPASTS